MRKWGPSTTKELKRPKRSKTVQTTSIHNSVQKKVYLKALMFALFSLWINVDIWKWINLPRRHDCLQGHYLYSPKYHKRIKTKPLSRNAIITPIELLENTERQRGTNSSQDIDRTFAPVGRFILFVCFLRRWNSLFTSIDCTFSVDQSMLKTSRSVLKTNRCLVKLNGARVDRPNPHRSIVFKAVLHRLNIRAWK